MLVKKVLLITIVAVNSLLISCLDTPEDLTTPYDFDEQLSIDIEIIEAYLEENDLTATKHTTGIYYEIVNGGKGDPPASTDIVEVDYEGRLLDGFVFDSSREVEEKPAFPLNNLIAAWQYMLPLIGAEGSIIIYAPSGYCYGPYINGDIPKNSCLIFEVDLLSINP